MPKKYPAKKKAPAKKKVKITYGESIGAHDEKKWQAEDDVRTLMRAEEVKADKERLARAKAEARRQKSKIEKVA